jgi:hypothetical protein
VGVDGLYFRVSSDRQTTENQFEGLLLIAQKDGSTRDWCRILAKSVFRRFGQHFIRSFAR